MTTTETEPDAGTGLDNFEVAYGTFGPFQNGEIIPLWWLEGRKHHVPSLIEQGVLVRTQRPTNCEGKLFADAPKSAADPAPAMQAEIDRLKRDNEALARSARACAAEAADLKEQHAIKDRSLGAQTLEIGRLRKQLDAETARREAAESRAAQLAPKKKPEPAPAG